LSVLEQLVKLTPRAQH